jgi:GTP-binding protein
MLDMINNPDNTVHLTYLIPTRGLLGFRYQFLTATRGMGVMNTLFHGYLPMAGVDSRATSSIVAWEAGHDHHLRLEECRRARRAVHWPGRRCV